MSGFLLTLFTVGYRLQIPCRKKSKIRKRDNNNNNMPSHLSYQPLHGAWDTSIGYCTHSQKQKCRDHAFKALVAGTGNQPAPKVFSFFSDLTDPLVSISSSSSHLRIDLTLRFKLCPHSRTPLHLRLALTIILKRWERGPPSRGWTRTVCSPTSWGEPNIYTHHHKDSGKKIFRRCFNFECS